MTDRRKETGITLGEVYRLIERVEKKIDETAEYTHMQTHDLRNMINAALARLEVLTLKSATLETSILRVDGRVDRIYQRAAAVAAVISSVIWGVAQLVMAWWKH